MGRIRDLFKALSTNENATSQEENEQIQAELMEFLKANGESENRIATLEAGLEAHNKRAELQEELKAQANAKEAVEKTKRKSTNGKNREGQERE